MSLLVIGALWRLQVAETEIRRLQRCVQKHKGHARYLGRYVHYYENQVGHLTGFGIGHNRCPDGPSIESDPHERPIE